ncbi:DUF4062 domain-containing protein [Rhodocaloribacter litoris]|uniref:DUF4062 domain-containing protein n=1 Tax=Rhodocaloribacter litoris TaxID=2558931 RepID=UPI001420D5C4|nr:DUF4062 domain-containing protein [Rhodocaloribacter litoris]QXD15802.1 DUF4062 domain-containing protein [Rhodocaloribacter litoris]
MKPKVFVSSVMEGFEPFRKAARTGIEAAGSEPMMAEDWPSLGNSPRTACLDLVASSDALILIIGERGGWTAPSGLLVVEEEWQEAQQRKLPVRVFVQEGVTRDAEAERLVAKVSDYVAGYFRRTFTDPDSLAAEVQQAVKSIEPLPAHAMTPDADALRSFARAVADSQAGWAADEKTLRFVLAPERAGEVIDPRRLDDPAFHHAVMTAAQHPNHRLIDYGQPVVPRVQGTALVLERMAPQQNWREARPARIEVHEHGLILIDAPLETKSDLSGTGTIPSHILNEDRLEGVLTAVFQFAGTIYAQEDPYLRFERLQVDIALAGVHGAVLERNPQPRSSYTIPDAWMQGMHGPAEPLTPLPAPRVVNRRDLEHPDDEVSRLMAYLRRALAS